MSKSQLLPPPSVILALLSASAGLALLLTCKPILERYTASESLTSSEALYLPDERAVNLVSFGYRKALSTFLWFRTINYFGKHYAGDQRYQWLYHMCDLVTTLDPKARHVYEFGSNILAWEASAPQEAYQLLSKGMLQEPDYWKYPYLRGFISLYFLNNQQGAKEDFVTASHLPGVHPMVVGLAAKTVALQEDPEQAISFLRNVLNSSDDPSVKKVLMDRLRELSYERDLSKLEQALNRYREAHHSIPAQIDELAPYLDSAISLVDPFGGNYIIDAPSGTIKSTSNHKRFGNRK